VDTVTDIDDDLIGRAATAARVMGLPALATVFETPVLDVVTPVAAELVEQFDDGRFDKAVALHDETEQRDRANALDQQLAEIRELVTKELDDPYTGDAGTIKKIRALLGVETPDGEVDLNVVRGHR
jgi:ParB-like chromosome segregation protein Spo0J